MVPLLPPMPLMPRRCLCLHQKDHHHSLMPLMPRPPWRYLHQQRDHNHSLMPLVDNLSRRCPQLETRPPHLTLWDLLHYLEGWRHKGMVEGVPPLKRSVTLLILNHLMISMSEMAALE